MIKEKEFNYGEFVKKFRGPDKTLSLGKVDSSSELIDCESIKRIKGLIEDLFRPEVKLKKHVLVTGPSEAGKTFVINRVAQSYHGKLNYIYLKLSWTLKKRFGDPEERLNEIFDFAIKKQPSVVFLDRLDVICERKRRPDLNRIFEELDSQLEYIKNSTAKVLVFAATNKPEFVDEQITSYFKGEVKFTLPNVVGRRAKLIGTIKSCSKKTLLTEQIDKIAEVTHCYSFDDIEVLCYDALQLSRGATLCYEHFEKALADYKPVSVRSVVSPCPPIRWEDIGGVESIKMDLEDYVIWPLKRRDDLNYLGLEPIRGIMLYGPPGCSKTMLARAVATESGYNFISIKGPELVSKYVGDSEAAVRKLYRNAREIAPCIIFFDEIEAMAPERGEDKNSPVGDRVTAQLLTILDGIEPLDDVFTIAATNQPHKVDPAMLRPGRLESVIYVPLPSRDDRVKIFLVHMKKLERALKLGRTVEEAAGKLADKTMGYSGADIARICKLAGWLVFRENRACENQSDMQIEWRHFERSLEQVKPSTRPSQLRAFARFHEMTLQSGQQDSFAVSSPDKSAFFSDELHKLSIHD